MLEASVIIVNYESEEHVVELDRELSALGGRDVRVAFTAQVVPMARGILSTLYAALPGREPAGLLHIGHVVDDQRTDRGRYGPIFFGRDAQGVGDAGQDQRREHQQAQGHPYRTNAHGASPHVRA